MPISRKSNLEKRSPSAALLARTEFQQLTHDLDEFRKVCEIFDSHNPGEEDIQDGKRALAGLDALRHRWAAVDKPASLDQIATSITRLISCFPNLNRMDVELLARALGDDVADSQPTQYVLEQACRAVRRKSEFLSIAKVLEQIEAAERYAKKQRYLLFRFPLDEWVASAEADLPDRLARAAGWDRRYRAKRNRLKAEFPDLPHLWGGAED
jgi:hypothetical protein